ncbi:hypothetical protein [Bordetella genomosp. 5]|nr:hypothetical protein [Bordetella genomosp. 5]
MATIPADSQMPTPIFLLIPDTFMRSESCFCSRAPRSGARMIP